MARKLICLLMAAAATVSVLAFSGCNEPSEPATPDSAPTRPATPDAPKPSATPDQTSENNTKPATPPKKKPSPNSGNGSQFTFNGKFKDFPTKFINHSGKPDADDPDLFYLDASISFDKNGMLTGELKTNIDPQGDEPMEQASKWTGKIRDGKLYQENDYTYYFYLDDVSYDHDPETTGKQDGKDVTYVYGFALDPEDDYRLYLYTPDAPVDSIISDEVPFDLNDFITRLGKKTDGDKLGCYLLLGRIDNVYVSIKDDEVLTTQPPQP